ncbi:hypothetical protein [Malikia sp.]|uniref:hypothetical protein n=1 Tax=Malikia sp. TaxID=2070706 RepID=UPI0026037804|nr:hypothetical protein [Malikia sp.]MDD2728303.1 hypothetical protein [Malikia sp.]
MRITAAQQLAAVIGLDLKNVVAFTIRARLDGTTVTVVKQHVFAAGLGTACSRFELRQIAPETATTDDRASA